jgi:hypothetical protein
MPHQFALLSIVFMTSFVLVFDKVHLAKWNARFSKEGLLSKQEIDQLQSILSACQEG